MRMINKISWISHFVILTHIVVGGAFAANITETGMGATDLLNCTFRVEGEIEKGDAEFLIGILNQITDPSAQGVRKNVICFSGEKGDFYEAVSIADELRRFSMVTSVPPGEICAGACAIAFMGGRDCCVEFGASMAKRHLSPGSELRFHAPELLIKNDKYSKAEVELTFSRALDFLTEIQLRQSFLKISHDLITKIIGHRTDSFLSIKPNPKYRYNYVAADGSIFQAIWEPSINENLSPVLIDSPVVDQLVAQPLTLENYSEHHLERLASLNGVFITSYSNERKSAVVKFEPDNLEGFFPLPERWHQKGASTYISRDGEYLVTPKQIALRVKGEKHLQSMPHIIVTSLQTGQEHWKLKVAPNLATAATISPDNQYIAATVLEDQVTDRSEIFKISLFEMGKDRPIGFLYGHDDHASSLIFTSDGEHLISSSKDGKSRIWNVKSQELVHQLDGTSEAASYDTVSPDGRYFVTSKKNIRIWNIATGEMAAEFPFEAGVAQFTPDGGKLLLSGGRKNIRILDIASKEVIFKINDSEISQGAVIIPKTKELVYSLPKEIKIENISNLLN